ncbi:MAG: carboxypeptidase-like regulatory domain-containing protein [Bacteroidota bacterium]
MKIIVTFLLLLSFQLQAQKRIEGIVKDSKGPIFAANVFFSSRPEQGTVTDFDGLFSLEVVSEADSLVVSYLGYKTKRIPLSDLQGNARHTIILKPTAQSLDEVILLGPDPISDKFAVKKLEKLDIYLNPVAQGDPLKAITILPASTIDDETVNPSLRGSDPDRSRVVFNNVPVYNPVRASQLNNQGFFSLFNTELIGDQYVYASNPPLTFGNTSAGLVEIQTIRSLNNDQLKLSTSLASTGFFVSKRVKEKESFLQLYGNYQFSEAFLGIQEEKLPDLKNFQTFDIGLNARWQLHKKLSLNSFSYVIDESFLGQREQFTFTGDFESAKTRGFTINNLNFASAAGFFNLNFGFNTESQNFVFGNTNSNQQTDQVFLSLSHKTTIRKDIVHQTSISWDQYASDFNDSFPEFFYAGAPDAPVSQSVFRQTNSILELGSFTSWSATQKLLVSGGLRTNLPTRDQTGYLSYQLGLRYKLNSENVLLLSGGKYHNYTTPSFFIQDYNLLNSEQVALDYTFTSDRTNLSAALYFKDEKGTQVVNQFLISDNLTTYGAELFVQHQFTDRLKLSVSYSFIQQETEVGDTTFPGLRDYDYFLKSSLEYAPRKWPTIALNWLGRPGRLFTPIVDGTLDTNTGFYIPNFSPEFLDSRYATYARLDISVNKYFSWKNRELVVFASINNLLNRANQRIDRYNFDYSQRSFDPYQLRLLYFGLVVTLNK